MRTTIKQIIQASEALQSIYNQKLPATAAYTLFKIIEKADKELELFNQIRTKLLEEKADKDPEQEGSFTFKDDQARMEFEQEVEKLLNKEVEIESEKLGMESLSGVEMRPSDVAALSWLIS